MSQPFRPVLALACTVPFLSTAAIGAPSQPEGLRSGAEAVRLLERTGRLDELAARTGLDAGELARTVAFDRSLLVDSEGRMIAVCPVAPAPADDSPFLAVTDPDSIPLSQAFNLSSRPGASKTMYLDFTGYALPAGTLWEQWETGAWDFDPYDTDGDPSTFSDQERREIIEQWVQIVEDFAAWDLNITTADPGSDALLRASELDQNYGIRNIMTQQPEGFGPAFGGIAPVGVFGGVVQDTLDVHSYICFSVNKGSLNGSMTASHEAGHTLGLLHDGLDDLTYHPGSIDDGSSSWGPIMGAPFGRNISQWSDGDYPNATNFQDDLLIFTQAPNNLPLLADDHAGIFSSATPLPGGQTGEGTIAPSDLDIFRVEAPCGVDALSLNVSGEGPNLDARVTVTRQSDGAVVADLDPNGTPAINATLSLAPGVYFFTVRPSFEPVTDGPISDYGSIGQYEITVDLTTGCCPADVNGDGTASPADFTAWLGCFNDPMSAPYCDNADVNASGTVDPADFTAWLAAFNAGCP